MWNSYLQCICLQILTSVNPPIVKTDKMYLKYNKDCVNKNKKVPRRAINVTLTNVLTLILTSSITDSTSTIAWSMGLGLW
jgi:hypothetical protein